MEIRIGTKYKHKSGLSGEFTSTTGGINSENKNFTTTSEFFDKIRSGENIITYYPYKEGDWVVALTSTAGFNIKQMLKITHINNEGFSLLNMDNKHVNSKWTSNYFRPAFVDEIPISDISNNLFKKRNWYEITNHLATYIIKVGDISKDSLDHCNFKVKNTNHVLVTASLGSFSLNKITTSKELTLEEVQKYLPNDHPDNFKNKNKETMNDDFEKQLAIQEQALILAEKAKNSGPVIVNTRETDLEFYKNSLKKITKATDYEVYTSVNAERSSTLNQIKPRSRRVNYNSTTLVMR